MNKENTIAIFKNTKKTKDTHPDYTGTVNIDGVDKQVALWLKEAKSGLKYMGGTISDPYDPNKKAWGEAKDSFKEKTLENSGDTTMDQIPF